jgi:Sigma-70, region 4/SnoaL-like domain
VSEPVWLEPYPDTNLGLEGPAGPDARYEQREAVELAFIAALQHLPARQRAVLILRDVLGFSARETAAVLGTMPVSVDSALQRAHKTVQERLPSQTQQQTLRLIGDDELSRLVGRYVDAWERNDVDAVDAMPAEDARMAMPPLPSWYGGRDQVAAFLRGYALADSKRWRLLPTSANDSPHWRATSGRRRPRRSCRGASTSSPCETPDPRDHGVCHPGDVPAFRSVRVNRALREPPRPSLLGTSGSRVRCRRGGRSR